MIVWAFRYLAIVVLIAGAFAALKGDRLGAFMSAATKRGEASGVDRPGPATFETVLRAGPNGHFWLEAIVNGEPVTFVVDTGASEITLSPADARRLGFRPERLRFDRRFQTANGEIQGADVRLREIRVGPESLYDIGAVVVDAPLAVSLLGTGFLRRLAGYEVKDDRLVLRW
jgi:clan AA aspartic protease (TIGR02281 family)